MVKLPIITNISCYYVYALMFLIVVEIQRRLLLGRKAMTNLEGILEIKDITLLTKVRLVKAIVFPVVMYGCELDYKES